MSGIVLARHLWSGATRIGRVAADLGGYDGLVLDFANDIAVVRDRSTAANNLRGPVSAFLANAGTSTKWVRRHNGLYVEESAGSIHLHVDPTHGRGLLVEPAATNLALYSSDFTQDGGAPWTLSNITAAKTATGPDGITNSASTLTATDANGTALQAITSSSAARITSCFIKRRTGSGTINMTQDNGSTWTVVTVTSEWTRVNVPVATLANPTVGIRIVTSGDEIDVWVFQHEVSATPTSPIPTAGSTVTRAVDAGKITGAADSFPINLATMSIFVEAQFPTGASGAHNTFVSVDDGTASNAFVLRMSSDAAAAIALGGAASGIRTTGTNDGGMNKMAARFQEDNVVLAYDGGAATLPDGTYDPPPDADRLRIGALAGLSNILSSPLLLKKLVIVPRAWSDAELEAKVA